MATNSGLLPSANLPFVAIWSCTPSMTDGA